MEALNLNGNNSGGEDSGDSPTLNKYEYMSKNLSMRLNQMSSNFVSVDGTVSWLLEVPQVGEKLMAALESLLSSSFGVFPWHRCQIFDDDLEKLF